MNYGPSRAAPERLYIIVAPKTVNHFFNGREGRNREAYGCLAGGPDGFGGLRGSMSGSAFPSFDATRWKR